MKEQEQEQERESGPSRVAQRCAVCGRVVAILSLVVLAKRLRDLRHARKEETARKQESAHRRFPSFGH